MAIVGSAYVVVRALTDKLNSDIQSSLKSSNGIGEKLGQSIGRDVRDSFERETGGIGDGIDLSAARDRISNDLESGARDGVRAAEREIKNADLESAAGNAGGRGGRSLGDRFAAGLSGSGASGSLQGLILRIGALVPVISIAVGALSSLVSGLFALAAAVAPAVNALAVVPGILGGLVQGIGAVAIAFGGVGAAFKAGSKAAVAGAGSAVGASNQVAKAQRRVADVTRQNQKATEQAARAVRDAQRGLGDAYEKASERAVRASRDLYSAQRDLSKAQHEAAQAQADVNRARLEAAESLQQLGFSTRGAAIDEGQALIALQRARENLARFLELPVDNRLRVEAQLAADEAQLNYEKAADRAGDLKKENAAASKAGVEGSDQVIKAKQDEADAQERVLDATVALKDAQDELAKTQRDNARDIADAQERLTDALKAQKDVAIDNARRLADAMDSVKTASAGGAKGINAYNNSLKNLSPEARQFVKYLLSIRDTFRAVRNEAGKELFPKLEQSLRTLIGSGILTDVGKGLRESGSIIGDLAIKVAGLSNDPFFRGNFSAAMRSNNKVLSELTAGIAPLLSALVSLTAAAAPVTEEFARWIRIKAEAIAAYTGVGKGADEAAASQKHLRDVIKDGADVAKQLGRIFGNVAKALFGLGKTARPAGQKLLDAFERVTKKWSDFANDPDNGGMLKKYFDDVAENVRAIGRLAQSLGRSFARLGDDPSIAKVADILANKVVPTLEDIFANVNDKLGPQLADTLDSILKAFESLSDSPAFQIVLGIFKAFADTIKALATNPYTRPALFALLSFLAAMKSIQLIGDFIGLRKMVGYFRTLSGLLKSGKLAKGVRDVAGGAAAKPGAGGKSGGALGGAGKKGAAGAADDFTGNLGALARQFAITGAAKDDFIANLKILQGVFAAGPTGKAGAAGAGAAAAGSGGKGKKGGLGAAAEKDAKGVGKLRGALNGLIPGFALLSAPVLAVIGVVATLIGLFIGAYKNSEKLRATFKRIGVALSPVISKLKELAGKALKALGDGLAIAINWLIDMGVKAMPYVVAAAKKLGDAFKKAQPFLSKLGEILVTIARFIVTKVVPVVFQFEKALFKIYVTIISKVITVLVWLVKIIAQVVVGIVKFGVKVYEVFKSVSDWISARVADIISVVASIAGKIAKFAVTMFDSIKKAITTAKNWVRDRISDIVSFVSGLKSRVGKAIGDAFGAVKNAISSARNWVRDRISDIVSFVTGIGRRIGRSASNAFDSVKNAISNAKDWVRDRIDDIVSSIRGIKNRVTSAARGMWDGIKNAFKGALNGIIDLWNDLEFKLPSVKVAGKTVFGGVNIGTPNIPHLATGGIVPATRGGTLALLAEAGRPERVQPLGVDGLTKGERAILAALAAGRGPVSVHIDVHPSPGMNEGMLASEINRRLGWTLGT